MLYIFKGGSIVYDGSTLSEEKKREAVIIAEKPIEEDIEGKTSILKWDIESQEVWYEYVDSEISEQEGIKETIDNLGKELAQEKFKNIQKDTVISNLGQEVGKMKLDIIQLKGSVQ